MDEKYEKLNWCAGKGQGFGVQNLPVTWSEAQNSHTSHKINQQLVGQQQATSPECLVQIGATVTYIYIVLKNVVNVLENPVNGFFPTVTALFYRGPVENVSVTAILCERGQYHST